MKRTLYICIAAFLVALPALAGQRSIGGFNRLPSLLTDKPSPPVVANPDSNIVPHPAWVQAMEQCTAPDCDDPAHAERQDVSEPDAKSDGRDAADDAPPQQADVNDKISVRKPPAAPAVEPPEPPPIDRYVYTEPEPPPYVDDTPPTPQAVENYRIRLEDRLLEKYNNQPDYAGRVAKVSVVLSKPLEHSLDGKFIRAEFDQLVYDSWGKRIPALEKEYYVITFGSGGAEQVRSDPSIRVGLDLEKTYSERAPAASDPFRNVEPLRVFKPTPTIRMPHWWRPEYPELD